MFVYVVGFLYLLVVFCKRRRGRGVCWTRSLDVVLWRQYTYRIGQYTQHCRYDIHDIIKSLHSSDEDIALPFVNETRFNKAFSASILASNALRTSFMLMVLVARKTTYVVHMWALEHFNSILCVNTLRTFWTCTTHCHSCCHPLADALECWHLFVHNCLIAKHIYCCVLGVVADGSPERV